jgi:FdhE protein
MASTQSARLLSPEEIAVQAGHQAPHLRLPERDTVFGEREMRLRQLAASHTMRDFLLFMAEVARAQQQVLLSHPSVALPAASVIDSASRLGVAPLPSDTWQRDPAWLVAFRQLLSLLLPRLPGGVALERVRTLTSADEAWIEQQADRLLNGVMLGLDLATAPLIAAGLQTYWTHLVLATQGSRSADRAPPFGRVDDATLCPCCASRPTSSVVRIGSDSSGYRYLHCSLCSAQWHMVRIKCTNCESTKGIHYQSMQAMDTETSSHDAKRAVEAETCDECGHYLKIVHMERDPHVEPAADDLATVTLDLLVAEAGFQRHGINLMLLFGDPDDPGDSSKPASGGAGA